MAAKKGKSKNTLVDKVVLLSSSLVYLTKGATDELVDVLEKNTAVSSKEGRQAVEKVKAELDSRKKSVQSKVVKELGKALDALGVATKRDLEKLSKKAPSKKSAK